MIELADAYAYVERAKDDPVDVPSAGVQALADQFREQYGRPPTSAEVQTSIKGFGWVRRMAEENDLSLVEAVHIAERIADASRENIDRAQVELAASDAFSAGVGVGFFTGLWMGMLVKEGT